METVKEYEEKENRKLEYVKSINRKTSKFYEGTDTVIEI